MTRASLPIRLIASDLDGTLLGGDLRVSDRTRAALAAAIERGVVVTLATGRMYRSTLPHARALGMGAPLICYQGAYIRTIPGDGRGEGDLLFHRPMEPDVAREAVAWARDRGFEPHVNLDDRLICERGDGAAQDYERRSGVGAEFVRDLLAAIDRPVTKVLAVGAAPLPEQSLDAARAAFAGRAHPTVSHRDYLEWSAPGVHKGLALRWLAGHLGIPLAQAMAIGDQHNDVEMLADAGHGVAMGGSPDAVRSAARYVTRPFEDDGAAVAIEALVLGRGTLD